MHRPLVIVFSILAFFGMAAGALAQCDMGAAIKLTGKSCNPLTPPQLSCAVPKDVQGGLSQANNNTVQRAADIFSWQQFIALNWPAAQGKRGAPAADQPIGAAGPRVWETWKEAYEVYRPNGSKPVDWNTPERFPAACGGVHKMLFRTSKVSDVVDQTLQALPADGTLPASLKDQNGRLVRYEIRLNRAVFDYVVQNGLYDGQQQTQASSIDFPVGSQLVKAAWREVNGDDAKYFFATDACVCEDKGVDTPSNCQVRRMGLAGFHLMTKTASAPQWIWSTYEQVDNVTASHPAVQPLNNPSCPASQCPPNKQTPDGVPTQLTRVIPIPAQDPVCSRPGQAVDNIKQLNGDVQSALAQAGSVLANYHLVNTQWPVQGTKQPRKTVFDVRPALLGNTTMESFSQDTSSCMGCHVMSRTLKPDAYVSGDFSFTLNNAQPRPKGSRCVDVEASESCNDAILTPPPKLPPTSNVYWPVLHGYAVATKTYETVGAPYVGNKLHCQSCHLNAGGNPDAAWWVDMAKYYKNTAGLQTRINSCFKHSMNGQPLCDPTKKGDCEKNRHMVGLIAYMNWLTEQYYRKHPKTTPARYFPDQNNPAFNAKGNPVQGQAIYTQKCAFCHNKDGQGRYENGYFRPALWGANSYNASAGMGPYQGTSSTLAAFLHGNMPYTSGGLLTITESVDLAAFINGQCRPGKKTGPNGKPCPTK